MDPRWTSLYESVRPVLYRALASILGDAEAEDVVQETFERAMAVNAFFDEVRDPPAWLRRVGMRLALSRLRRRVIWERIRPRVVLDSSGDPEVAWALSRLPATQRAAIILRYYFRDDYPAIASTLNLRESSVAKTLSRARAALRRDLT